jgi:hypothetical protein
MITQGRTPIERLLQAFEAHAEAEQDSIAEERRLAASLQPSDATTALLLNQVVADEERHHELLARMAASLADSIRWSHSTGGLPEDVTQARGHPEPEVVRSVRKLLQEEREGIRAMRRLARETSDLYGGLFTLLLNSVIADSRKHEMLLRFVLRRLEEQNRADK